MKTSIAAAAEDLLALFYPSLCSGCGEHLPFGQRVLCIECLYTLPLTSYHDQAVNPLDERFWGRLPIESATALCYFSEGGIIQRLIHRLKYQSDPEVGHYLGLLLGQVLKGSERFGSVDLILPIPLHRVRQRQRGYNQSDKFARGLAQAMDKPWSQSVLGRRLKTATQTRKGRIGRFFNVEDAFEVRDPDKLRGKWILLVDDVMTTGATLEACGRKILEIPGTRLSFATIACAT